MKKLLLFLLLVFAITLLFCSCNSDGSADSDDDDTPPQVEDTLPDDDDKPTVPEEDKNDEEEDSVCNHNYEKTVITNPEILENGLARFVCSLCRHEYCEPIPATRSIKLLCIGNSFSVDAVQHLYGLLTDAGVENILIGNLYVGGCTLKTHWDNIDTENAAYRFYLSNKSKKSKDTRFFDFLHL